MAQTGRNDPCPCGSGKKWKKCHMNMRGEVGVLRKSYNTGDGDDFYSRFLMGHSNIRECAYPRDKRQEYDKSFNRVFQNLSEMKIVKDRYFATVAKHRAAVESGADGRYHGHQIDVNEPVDDDLNILFKDFFIRGQMAVQALIKHARYMGYNISFLFAENERKFRSGLQGFALKEDDERFKALHAFIGNHTTAWYAPFREMRRQIEHEGWSLPNVQYSLNDDLKVQIHFPKTPDGPVEDHLQQYWENIVLFCEEILTFLLSLKLPEHMIIAYIPEERRDKHMPVRYIVSLKAFPGVPLSCG